MKFDSTLMMCVKADIEAGLIPMLLGPPGIGKSSYLEELANILNTKCFTLACNQLADKADLTGARLVPTADGQSYVQVFYPHAVIHDAIEYAKENPRETPLLFLDELNRTTPDVTSEALSIPTMRSIGSVKLPSNLRVVIAGNDKGNVTSLDDASISRFVLYRVEPDTQTFLDLDDSLNEHIRKVLIDNPHCLYSVSIPDLYKSDVNDDDTDTDSQEYAGDVADIFDIDDEMEQITTPRTISGLSRWLNSMSNDQLVSLVSQTVTRPDDDQAISALQEVIEGHVGRTRFSMLLINEIISHIDSASSQSTRPFIPQPTQFYEKLKNASTVGEVDDLINNMSDSETSATLLYCLYDNTDNDILITHLSQRIDNFDPRDIQKLVKLMSEDMLDSHNVSTFLDTSTHISEGIRGIITM